MTMQIVTCIAVFLSSAVSTLCFDMPANHYVGFFQKDDLIVAHDYIYKAAHPFNKVKAEYGRAFPCIISHYTVLDKTKYDVMPDVATVRGGLGQHFVSLVITSPISKPLAVSVYVACHNVKGDTGKVGLMKSTESTEDSEPVNESEESELQSEEAEIEPDPTSTEPSDEGEIDETETASAETAAIASAETAATAATAAAESAETTTAETTVSMTPETDNDAE